MKVSCGGREIVLASTPDPIKEGDTLPSLQHPLLLNKYFLQQVFFNVLNKKTPCESREVEPSALMQGSHVKI